MSGNGKRYCVVTPYYKEDVATLTRCMDSVARQTIAVDHFLVADGFPQDWLDSKPVRHIKLDRAHGDFGNVARGVGALLAVSEKYDGIAFLDADNWYDDDHIASCLAALEESPRSLYAAARRRFVRPNASVMETVTPAELPFEQHVDTNCFFFKPRLFYLLHHWCTIPRELSASGDRLFFLLLYGKSVTPAVVSKPTVNYLCMIEQVYRAQGEEPPPGAKPSLQWKDRQAWIDSRTPEEMILVKLLTGLDLQQTQTPSAGAA